MKNVLALVNLHDSQELGLLTEKRPLATTTFLGRYAIIDFALSNLSNSGIDDLGIMIKDNSRSIIKHIRNDNTYLKNTKTGVINLMINEEGIHNPFFNTDLNNIIQNDYFLYDTDAKYILIVPAGVIYQVDFKEVIDEHIKYGKKISVVYKKDKDCAKKYFGLNKITINALGNVQKAEKIDPKDNEALVGLKTYVINKDALKEFIKKAKQLSNVYTLDELLYYLQKYTDTEIHAIEYKGHVAYPHTLEQYYDLSMTFKDLFGKIDDKSAEKAWKIFTGTHDTRPVLYGEDCEISDSLISNGCTIRGKVKNSILGRNVKVEEGAVVENSIIFSDVIVKKGIHLNKVIADKLVHFETKEEVGDGKDLVFIPQGEII